MAIKRVKKERAVSSKHLEDHIVDETVATVHNPQLDGSTDTTHYDVKQGEVHSDTHLEDDKGEGGAVVIRSFIFRANPEAFRERTPSKQELFNAHAAQIESVLWEDGLKVMPEIKPQLKLSKDRKGYRIIVGAEPRNGQNIVGQDKHKFQTLSQAAHGRFTST